MWIFQYQFSNADLVSSIITGVGFADKDDYPFVKMQSLMMP
jgi:hypothetical protein